MNDRSLRPASAASTNAINRDRSRSEEDQCKCNCPERQGKFVAAIAHKPVLPVDPGDSHDHVHENSKGNAPREQTGDQQDATAEFRKRRDVAEPGREPKTGHMTGEFVQMAVYLLPAMADQDGAQDQAQDHQSQRLHSIEIAQASSAYSSEYRLARRAESAQCGCSGRDFKSFDPER